MHRKSQLWRMLTALPVAAGLMSQATAQQQPTVYLLSGSVSQPPNLKEEDPLGLGTSITTGPDALVILRYSWPSEEQDYPCVRWVIIAGPYDKVLVEAEDTPGRCTVSATGTELDDIGIGSRFVRRVTFYGGPGSIDDAKGDQGAPRPTNEKPDDKARIDKLGMVKRGLEDNRGPSPPPSPGGLELSDQVLANFSDGIVSLGVSYNQDDGYRLVLVATRSGVVHEVLYRPRPGNRSIQISSPNPIWNDGGVGIVAISAFYSEDDRFRHLIVATRDGKLHEVFYHPTRGRGESVIGSFDGIVDIAAFYNVDDHYRVVLVATKEGKVWERFFKPDQPGGQSIIKDFGNSGVLRIAGTFVRSTQDRRLVAVTRDGSVHQLLYHPNRAWREERLYSGPNAAWVAVSGRLLVTGTSDGTLLSITGPQQVRTLSTVGKSRTLSDVAMDYWATDDIVYSTSDGALHRLVNR